MREKLAIGAAEEHLQYDAFTFPKGKLRALGLTGLSSDFLRRLPVESKHERGSLLAIIPAVGRSRTSGFEPAPEFGQRQRAAQGDLEGVRRCCETAARRLRDGCETAAKPLRNVTLCIKTRVRKEKLQVLSLV